ncbi:class I SAM-dependent methyltransferase [Hydrogenothermus marinus]|uniref:SAM-dependent MidA family methyltransferase n=1 Tax=Hydrogenothermus marinus TaxID=133270 RepID=A0A3M0B8M4_9AQUI|nr:SAM-dependent methyltransferase [Hydrogenothermus marinus]RMA92489.1 SAM-dependent MidA family methyltransferase [Hydrogenothermus marinus]
MKKGKVSGKKELIEIIKKRGTIPFSEFMDITLYYPELGYYTSDKSKIGGKGDFFTASELDPVFGQLLAKQFVEIYEKLNTKKFKIVEIGAGKGYLAYDILSTLKNEYPKVFENITYVIIEKSPYHIKIQKELLKDFENIDWKQDIIDFKDNEIEGIVFSNELFDAFPVELIKKKNGKIYQIFVKIDEENNLYEIEKEATEEILRYLKELNINIPEGMTTEINLGAKDYIIKIGKKLKRGYVITIDYGYPSAELYKPYRMKGSLLCYYQHKYSENYWENIGLQDITSHVNFSALSYYGKLEGLETVGFTDQAHFLTNLGLMEIFEKLQEIGDYKAYERMNRLKTLVLPKGMGEKFKILVQAKNVKDTNIKGLDIIPPQTDRYKL